MDLKEELSKRVVTVTFTKKNGEEREMACTRNMDSIPPSAWPIGKIEVTSESNVRVWDVKAQGWRSFILENVKGFV